MSRTRVLGVLLIAVILIAVAGCASARPTPPPSLDQQLSQFLQTGQLPSGGLSLDPMQVVSAVMGVTVQAIGQNAAIFAVAFVWQWHTSWALLEILVGLALVGGMFVGLWKPPEYLTLSEALIIVLMFVFIPLGLITYMGILVGLQLLSQLNINIG